MDRKHYFELDLEQFGYITISEFLTQYSNSKIKIRFLLNKIFQVIHFLSINKFVHGDLHFGNILINPMTFDIRIIDFDSVREVSSPYHAFISNVADLFLQQYLGKNEYYMKIILEEYSKLSFGENSQDLFRKFKNAPSPSGETFRPKIYAALLPDELYQRYQQLRVKMDYIFNEDLTMALEESSIPEHLWRKISRNIQLLSNRYSTPQKKLRYLALQWLNRSRQSA